jgi:aldose 1-epimerase
MTNELSLAAGDARVVLAPATGGAIAQFTFRGTDVLRPLSVEARAAGNARGYSCYPLVPYSNRIANANLVFEERAHDLARNFGDHPHSIHGVGWQRAWSVVAHDTANALLMLLHTAAGADAAAWPWSFRATQSFALAADDNGSTLTARITLTNTDSASFPFGLGFHPFFPRTGATALGFRAEAVWETEGTQLPTKRVPAPDAWRFDPARAIGDVALDNVFTGWDGMATLSDSVRRLAITIAADRAAGFLVVYIPPGRDFLAVEPVTHMTDAFNRAERGEKGTGTRVLDAGAAFSCTMRISVHALP